MKLILENIGKIKKAEIDLEHQLTVFFGPNNTGKTYVSYCLYGLGKRPIFIDSIGNVNRFFDLNFNELFEKGRFEIDLVKNLLPYREELKIKFVSGIKNYLPQLFGNYNVDQFLNSLVNLSFFDNDDSFEKYIINTPFAIVGHIFERSRSIAFDKKDGILIVEIMNFNVIDTDSNVKFSNEQIIITLKQDILQNLFVNKRPYFIPSERNGISVFGKEIILNRFAQTNSPIKEPFTPYSVAVFDAVENQFRIASFKNNSKNSFFLPLAEDIESDILQGKLSINDSGDVLYHFNGDSQLSILNSASTIKSLSSLVFYLRVFARTGDTLFIDEPEINLHPENQRKIAKILAKISNLGIKVYVSTHSDYIIREFNNLMMLGKESIERERLMTEYGYKKDEILNYRNVGAYLFNAEGYPRQVEVTETGFSAETIDETINNQNKATNDISWTLFDV